LACVALATTPVFMNSDHFHRTYDEDRQLMNEISNYLGQHNYKCEIGSIGPNAHYKEVDKVKQNGIYMVIFGGACAGTLHGIWVDKHFSDTLKKKNAKMVVAFLSPPSCNIHCLEWLPRSKDDNFSPPSFKGVYYPEKNLLEHGFGVAIGSSALDIVKHFPGFASTDTCPKYRANCKSPLVNNITFF